MSSSEFYAFLKECPGGSAVKELLLDHLRRTAEVIKEARGSKALRYLEKVSEVPEDALLTSLTAAGVLHDVGKALYQHHIHKDRIGCRTLSFPGHEVVSAYILWMLRNRIREYSGCDEGLADPLTLALTAVLYHHHPMSVGARLKKAKEVLNALKNRLKEDVGKLERGLREVEVLLPQPLRRPYNDVLRPALSKLVQDPGIVLREFYLSAREELFKEMSSSVKVKGGVLAHGLATSILVVADYTAAAAGRGNPSSLFSSVVREFRNYYLVRVGGRSWS